MDDVAGAIRKYNILIMEGILCVRHQKWELILQDVENFNREHGYTAEWIFQNGSTNYDGRLSYNAADRKLRKICSRFDTAIKSPHKRRSKDEQAKAIDETLALK